MPSEIDTSTPDVRLAVNDWKQVRTHLWVLSFIIVCTAILRYRPEWVIGLSPKCLFQLLFHINCPFCGMTRDFVAILHGQLPKLNPSTWATLTGLYVVYPLVFLWAWRTRRLDVFYKPAIYKAGLAAFVVMFILNNLHIK